jgi:hypothetical protein
LEVVSELSSPPRLSEAASVHQFAAISPNQPAQAGLSL